VAVRVIASFPPTLGRASPDSEGTGHDEPRDQDDDGDDRA